MSRLTFFFSWAYVLIGASAAAADNTDVLAGKVDAVTVYRGQAMVTRTVDVPGPAGLHEVIVADLPEHVLPGSLYAESDDQIEIRSVRYRIRPVKEDVRDEVREIDQGLQDVQDKVVANERRARLLEEKTAYLDGLEEFSAQTANLEISRGVLNAGTLKELTGFLFEQRGAAAEEELRLGLERRDLEAQREVLQREREVVAGSSARTVREAVVFAHVPSEGGGRLKLKYLVDQATWSPYYSVRAAAGRERVDVEYYAAVRQTSGEDWSDVHMTLSTATPNLVAKAPELEPLTIRLASFQQVQEQSEWAASYLNKDYGDAVRELARRRNEMEQQRATQTHPASKAQRKQQASAISFDEDLNLIANDSQVLDLVTQQRVRRGERRPGRTVPNEGVSVTYGVTERTSLPSRSDQQLIRIASLPMSGEFYRRAVPVLTDYVYEQATLGNDSDLVLLAGPVATYVGGEFVGNGELPTVASGERFTVGLGIDPSLRIRRELLDKTDRIQGGNRIVTLSYRLTVENFGSEPAAVRLFDRLPKAEKHEVKITFEPEHPGFSSDPMYLKTERPKGILRWDIQAPPRSTGPDALTVEYDFTLEYDKQMTIAPLPGSTT